jgi:hypothetical protein
MKKICIICLCMLLFFSFVISVEVKASGDPLFQNLGQSKSSIRPGDNIILYAQGKDDVALNWSWLATNETGEWKNYADLLEWNYYKQIVIDHTMVEDDFHNFPVAGL